MRISDLRTLPAGSVITRGICIVGGGPAGLTIATEFANTHHDVLVIESGSRAREDQFSTSLNEIESLGVPRVNPQRKVRNRVLGGTSHTWSGRCTPMDAIDFEQRPWVPCSGWPLRQQELGPYLERAARHLGLIPMNYDQAALLKELALVDRFNGSDGSDLQTVFWQFSRRSAINDDYVRFGPRFARLSAKNISVLTNATVTQITTNQDGNHVSELEIRAPDGRISHIRAQFIVLAAGGIENARLLLASNRQDPHGVGNQRGWVGRCLMDHPRAVLGTFEPGAIPKVQTEFGMYRHPSGAKVMRGVTLTPEVQRRERLLNCVAWTTQHVADDDAWRALRSIGRANGSDRKALARVVLSHSDQIVKGLWNKFVRGRPLPRRLEQLNLDALIEQVPDRDSRVLLSNTRRDALGTPIAAIDWHIGETERMTAIRLGHTVNDALASAGLPAATLAPWVRDKRPEDAVFFDPAHPSGTTRMAENEFEGVVDRDGKVFGIDNLFVAGSSVFSTSGHANPTLMLVALSLRLADKLRLIEKRAVPNVAEPKAAVVSA